jgi:hypothetical protein
MEIELKLKNKELLVLQRLAREFHHVGDKRDEVYSSNMQFKISKIKNKLSIHATDGKNQVIYQIDYPEYVFISGDANYDQILRFNVPFSFFNVLKFDDVKIAKIDVIGSDSIQFMFKLGNKINYWDKEIDKRDFPIPYYVDPVIDTPIPYYVDPAIDTPILSFSKIELLHIINSLPGKNISIALVNSLMTLRDDDSAGAILHSIGDKKAVKK